MCKRNNSVNLGDFTVSLSLGYPINGKSFPANSVIMRFNFGTVLVATNLKRNDQGKILLHVYSVKGRKWTTCSVENEYTKIMYSFYKKETRNNSHTDFASLMKHERKKKKSGSGSRLKPFCGHVTDYECTKNPLHDFRRVFV